MWINRIRQDFSLTLVVTFGVITNLMILPFAGYRLLSGQVATGLIDLLIVACITLGSVRAFVTRRTEGPALFLGLTYSTGCIAITYVAGTPGPLWMYAVLLSNFLLVDRKVAAVISGFAIAAVAASSLALPELAQKLAFIGSSVVVCLFSFAFAWRTDLQRQQLESLASLDPLTGAHNRLGMHAEIKLAVANSVGGRSPLGLIIFDLDHFKQINDRFGHEAGDNVLVEVARVVRRMTRRNERFFRLGGEEFALLIPNADSAGLREVAEKIRTCIERDVVCGDAPVTASFGASLLRTNESESHWRDRVDAAMYRAKHEGRNRTVVDEWPQPSNGGSPPRANVPPAIRGNDSRRDRADFVERTRSLSIPFSPTSGHSPFCRNVGRFFYDTGTARRP